MKIRALEFTDLEVIKEIHEKHFKDDFEFPDFFSKFHGAFVVTDNDRIISVGGVRPIAESVVITNKNYSVRDRREALLMILDFSKFLCKEHGFTDLYAFIQDDEWLKHIIKAGFEPTKGVSTILKV